MRHQSNALIADFRSIVISRGVRREGMTYEFTGMEDMLAMAPEARLRLEGAVVALVAEFIGAVTGLHVPLERALFPAEMEPALRRLCDGLIQVVHETT